MPSTEPGSEGERPRPPGAREASSPDLLSAVFQMAYARLRPRSLLAAPLAAARWLERVDARITRRVVGIDPDMERVALARRRYRHLGAALEVYRADALEARLQPEGDFDLVLVALPVDGLAPEPLAALLAGWVAPGGACAIAGPGDPEDGGALASLLARCGMRRAGSFGARQAGAAPLRVTLLRSPGRAK